MTILEELMNVEFLFIADSEGAAYIPFFWLASGGNQSTVPVPGKRMSWFVIEFMDGKEPSLSGSVIDT